MAGARHVVVLQLRDAATSRHAHGHGELNPHPLDSAGTHSYPERLASGPETRAQCRIGAIQDGQRHEIPLGDRRGRLWVRVGGADEEGHQETCVGAEAVRSVALSTRPLSSGCVVAPRAVKRRPRLAV